jgi:5-methylcytosine-specific restriction endonuclease McrA
MSKVRCVGCRTYFPKSDVYRSFGFTHVCSAECEQVYVQQPARRAGLRSKPKFLAADVRSTVLARDGNRCRCCSTNGGLHVHHVDYRSQGGLDVEHNLITLCFSCHEMVHSDKRRFQPLLRGVVWLTYSGRRVSVYQFERWLV